MSEAPWPPKRVDGAFRTTHWSLIAEAARDGDATSRRALSQLCESYWPPVYTFVRRRGHSQEEAKDLTQSFFLRLIEKKPFASADGAKGKFRSYLLGALKFFLANEWDKNQTQKRGGHQQHVPIDHLNSGDSQHLLVDTATPEHAFERQWAQTVLDHVIESLRDDYRRRGKTDHLEDIIPFLLGRTQKRYAELASEIGVSTSAVKMAVTRMRQRFGDLLRDHIAATVESESHVEEEIRHLMQAFQ